MNYTTTTKKVWVKTATGRDVQIEKKVVVATNATGGLKKF